MILRVWFRAWQLALLLTLSGTAACAATVTPPVHRGINILSWDPIWTLPDKARFKVEDFKLIRDSGFDFVRIVAVAFGHMGPDGKMNPQWLSTLDWAVKNATAAGLSVIIDEHDNTYCGNNGPECRAKLHSFWSEVAPRYRNAPKSVMFEILNEPHGQMNDIWQDTFTEMLAQIRKTNPTRIVVIGPTRSDSRSYLDSFELPEDDRNILVTFHYYEPMQFTHQGAPWSPQTKDLKGVSWGSAADRGTLAMNFGEIARWADRHGRPVLLGEFGAYDKGGTPVEQRAGYDGAIAREAEKNGFAWSYWQFDGDFIAFDMDRQQWVEPVRSALIPHPR